MLQALIGSVLFLAMIAATMTRVTGDPEWAR
jgi:hypothetical protein